MKPILYTADGEQAMTADPPDGAYIPLVGLAILLIALVFMLGYSIGSADLQATTAPPTPTISTVETRWAFPSEVQLKYASEQEEKAKKEKERKDDIWKHRPRLPAPPDAPPDSILVGPYTYHVHYTSAEALDTEQAWAITYIGLREIWLDPERAPTLRQDVLHELMHAAKDLGTADGLLVGRNGEEENMIKTTSTSLLMIMQNNPQLVAWLAKR